MGVQKHSVPFNGQESVPGNYYRRGVQEQSGEGAEINLITVQFVNSTGSYYIWN